MHVNMWGPSREQRPTLNTSRRGGRALGGLWLPVPIVISQLSSEGRVRVELVLSEQRIDFLSLGRETLRFEHRGSLSLVPDLL